MQPSQQQLSGKARRQHSRVGATSVQRQCATAAALCRPQPLQRHLATPPPASSNAAIAGRRERAVRCAAAVEDRMDKLRKESAQVEDRVATVHDLPELKHHLAKAGTKLVVLELQGEGVCEAGFDDPEPELHWKLDQESAFRKRMEACQAVKSRFQRTARDCPDVDFLAMQVSDDAEGDALKEQLGVTILPAVVFFKQGELLWHQEGYSGLENEIAEGVLYYDGQAAGGIKASQFVTELSDKRHMEDFVRDQHSQMLTVVNVSTSLCTPCVRVYPAVLALARNFVGQAAFARLLADEVDNPEKLMADLRILEVPAFLFFRGGVEVGRHVGSSRGDLIGQILKLQLDAGIRPPPPPPGSGRGAARAKASAAKRKVTSRW